jgi:hypothetical protein
MSDDLDAIGPVDYLVVEFPDTRIGGAPLRGLLDLVDRGLVRVLDLVVLRKERDGSVVVLEVADVDGDGELDVTVFDGATSGLLDGTDIAEAAAVIEPGHASAVLVYENLWAAPFASVLRKAGAEIVAGGRVPVAALLDSLDVVEAAADSAGA